MKTNRSRLKFSLVLFMAALVNCAHHSVTIPGEYENRGPAGVSSTPANRIGRFPTPSALAGESVLGLLPDTSMTPGAIDPCIHVKDICADDETTRDRRNTTAKQKHDVLMAYLNKFPTYKNVLSQDREHAGDGEGQFEVDHLISLEIGGADDVRNLWPEPFQLETAGAADKDRIEHHSKPELCDVLKAKGEKVADQLLAMIQRAIAAGFILNPSGQTQVPLYSWYHLYFDEVLPNLDSQGNQKPKVQISFANALYSKMTLLRKLPKPIEVPTANGCIAPSID